MITAKHAIISDECRQSRGDVGALDEALNRVRSEYGALTEIHKIGSGVKFHIKLDVEFTEPPTVTVDHG